MDNKGIMVVYRVLYYHPNVVVTVNGRRQKVWYPMIASEGTPCTTSRNQRGVRLSSSYLHASPHHSPRLHSHHLSLPLSFTPDLKLISFTILSSIVFLPSGRPPRILNLYWRLFVFVPSFLFLITCARLS